MDSIYVDISVDCLVGFFRCSNWFGHDTKTKWNCSVCSKKTSKPPSRKSAYLTLMNHKYSCSVWITCRDWRANDLLPCSALKLESLFTLLLVSALTFGILASAFPSQLILLEMSMEVHFKCFHWVVLSAHTALILMDLL